MSLKELVIKEGNRKEFNYRGYRCLIRRIQPEQLGHLCGYIRIPWGHDLDGMAYNDIEEHFYWELPAHGGLTFSGSLGGGRPYGHWIGFDCAHSHDISPMTPAKFRSYFEDAAYKDMDYVENNIKEIIDFIIKETEK